MLAQQSTVQKRRDNVYDWCREYGNDDSRSYRASSSQSIRRKGGLHARRNAPTSMSDAESALLCRIPKSDNTDKRPTLPILELGTKIPDLTLDTEVLSASIVDDHVTVSFAVQNRVDSSYAPDTKIALFLSPNATGMPRTWLCMPSFTTTAATGLGLIQSRCRGSGRPTSSVCRSAGGPQK